MRKNMCVLRYERKCKECGRKVGHTLTEEYMAMFQVVGGFRPAPAGNRVQVV